MSDQPAISVTDVVKRFTDAAPPALDGVTFTVAPGEFVALTGPSGSGKSTLLHLMAALDRPTSGSLVVDGVDLRHTHHLARYRRDRVGLVFQLHNLLPHLSAAQNVMVAMYGRRLRPSARRRRALDLLGALGLGALADRTPPELSGGERQRVAIARARANDPSVLLADEPTGSLDTESARLVIDHFRDLASRGHTVVAVTHDPKLLGGADRTIGLVSGRVPPPSVGPDGIDGDEVTVTAR